MLERSDDPPEPPRPTADASPEADGAAFDPTYATARTLDFTAGLPAGREETPLVRIAHFVLLERLGAGGMGVVYAAFDEKLERKVAIKLLRPERSESGLHDPVAQARLLREAQTLAQLSHPNVVTVYEVGTLPEGSVFIAMEFIKGHTLRDWQARSQRSWRDIVAMYAAAGAGLAAAHRAGIIHRDFKPDNVLVGEDGRLRVVDFGLARTETPRPRPTSPAETVPPAEPDVAALQRLTSVGALVGTPGYMAPEQFTGAGVDARTDQFSFCIALFEALYGERPFNDFAFARGAWPAPRRTRTEPVRPRWLWEALLRGLALEPAERFASIDDLLAELLRDRERTRRRRFLVAAAVAGTMALTGVTAAALTGRLRPPPCPRAEHELAGIWDGPSKQRIAAALTGTRLPYAGAVWKATAAALDGYAERWLGAEQAACEATYVRHVQSGELLDRRMECLAGRKRSLAAVAEVLSRQPAQAAEHTVEILGSLADIDLCADSGALLAGLPLPARRETVIRLGELRDHLARGHALLLAGDTDGARRELEEARRREQDLGYEPVRVEVQYLEGRWQLERGQVKEAIATLRHAAEAAVGNHHDELVADIWLALALRAGGYEQQPADIDEWLRQAEAWLRRLGHPRDPRWIDAEHARGWLEMTTGNHRAAQVTLSRALTAVEALWGKDDVRLLSLLRNRAHVYAKLGQAQPAVADSERALRISLGAFGPTHLDVARSRRSLGLFYIERLGAVDRGVREIEQARDIFRAQQGSDAIEVANCEQVLSQAGMYRGDYAAALDHAERADAIYRQRLGAANPRRGEALMGIGVLRFMRKDFAGSLAAYEEAAPILRSSLGAEHPTVAVLLSNTGETLLALGRPEPAFADFEQALAILRRNLGPSHVDLALPLKGIGLAALARHRPWEALTPLEEALSLRTGRPGDPQELAEIRWTLARTLRALGRDPARQRSLAGTALDAYRSLGPEWIARVKDISSWLQKPNKDPNKEK